MKYVMVVKTQFGDEYVADMGPCKTKEDVEYLVDKMIDVITDIDVFSFETIDGKFIILPKKILETSTFEFQKISTN